MVLSTLDRGVETIPPSHETYVVFMGHPDHVIAELRVAAEDERLDIPLDPPRSRVVALKAGVRQMVERFEVPGDERHRGNSEHLTRGVTNDEVVPSPQSDDRMARKGLGDAVTFRCPTCLFLVKEDEVLIAVPTFIHRRLIH